MFTFNLVKPRLSSSPRRSVHTSRKEQNRGTAEDDVPSQERSDLDEEVHDAPVVYFQNGLRSVKDGLLELGVPVHKIEPPLCAIWLCDGDRFTRGGLTSDLMRIPVLGAPIVSRGARRGRRRRIFLHDLSNSLPPWRLSVDELMEFNLLITLFSGCLKFIAGKPTRQGGLPRRLRSE